MTDKDTVHVVLTVKFDKEELSRLEDISPRIKLHNQGGKQASDIPNRVWKNAEVLYSANVIPQAGTETQLRWIQSHYAGVDPLVEHPFLESHPALKLTSMRGIHATVIGEYVLGMMIALGHHLPAILNDQRDQVWSETRYKDYVPRELRHSTVGILGYGSIGREVARLAKTFGAEVLATKRDVRTLEHDGFLVSGTGDPDADLVDRLYPTEATKFMVKECDFVVITLPLTEQTKGFYSSDVIDAMKEKSFLINIGRGGIIDEDALVEALDSGKLAGAAMDVFATEPLPSNHPLWSASNFILTPHLAGNTRDYNQKALKVFEDNLRRYLEDRPLQNLVDRDNGY